MKKLRMLLPVLAIVIAFMGSAFTKAKPHVAARAGEVWFSYSGTDDTPTNQNNLANYTKVDDEPGCEGDEVRCAILAQRSAGDPSKPDLSTIIQEDQHAALGK